MRMMIIKWVWCGLERVMRRVQTAPGPSQYSRIHVEKASECVRATLSLVWRWVRSDRTFSSADGVSVINSGWQHLHSSMKRKKKGFNSSIPSEAVQSLGFSPSSFRWCSSCSKRPLWLSIISSSPVSDAPPSPGFLLQSRRCCGRRSQRLQITTAHWFLLCCLFRFLKKDLSREMRAQNTFVLQQKRAWRRY